MSAPRARDLGRGAGLAALLALSGVAAGAEPEGRAASDARARRETEGAAPAPRGRHPGASPRSGDAPGWAPWRRALPGLLDRHSALGLAERAPPRGDPRARPRAVGTHHDLDATAPRDSRAPPGALEAPRDVALAARASPRGDSGAGQGPIGGRRALDPADPPDPRAVTGARRALDPADPPDPRAVTGPTDARRAIASRDRPDSRAAAFDAAREIDVQERAPLAFLLISPSGAPAEVRSSALIELVAQAIETSTDFAVENFDPEVVADCGGRLPCLVRAVRTDYDRDRLVTAGGRQPYAAHRERLEARGEVVPEALLVLSSVALGGEDRLVPQWVDTHEALALFHAADRDDAAWERDVEARVRAYAVPVRLPSAVVTSEAEARAFIERLVKDSLRPELERTGHWAPFGAIALADAPAGAALRLDDRVVGAAPGGPVVLRGVRPGRRRLELEPADGPRWSRTIDVPRGGRVAVTPDLGSSRRHPGRAALFWGGVGASAAGLALGAWALASEAPDTVTYCAPPCGDRFLAVGEAPSSPPAVGASGGGALAGPLGYALVLTGATWSLGSAFLGDEEAFPWWSALGGLVLGGTAYAVSAAVDAGQR